jgi:hypothetical protein
MLESPQIRDGDPDLFLAGFTLDQQQQAGDSSVVRRWWGGMFDRQTYLHGKEAESGGCRKDADVGA